MNFDSRIYSFSRAFEIEFKIQIYSAIFVAGYFNAWPLFVLYLATNE